MSAIKISKSLHSAARVVIISLLVLPFMFKIMPVRAADLLNRSLRISSPAVSTLVQHTFSFENPTATTIGSMVFEYCDSPLVNVACNASAGLDVSGATLTNQTGNVGFSIHSNTTANRLVIGRIPAGSLSSSNLYEFSNVMNPSVADSTYYVRISIHTSDDGTGAAVDRGSIAYVTNGAFSVGAYVPPFLIFCLGVTVSLNCDSSTGSLVSFGELSSTTTSLATTQFSGATNDQSGYQVFLNGQTMTSGNNIIPELLVPTARATGVSQFGLNMRFNNAPIVGTNPEGSGTATVSAKYNTSNLFAFGDGDVMASSPISTDFNRFTQSYMVNVSAAQEPGVYATTLLYTAVAAF